MFSWKTAKLAAAPIAHQHALGKKENHQVNSQYEPKSNRGEDRFAEPENYDRDKGGENK